MFRKYLALIFLSAIFCQNCSSGHSSLGDGTVGLGYTGPACGFGTFKIPAGVTVTHYSTAPCGSVRLVCENEDLLKLIVDENASFTVTESASHSASPPGVFNIENSGSLNLQASGNSDNVGYSFSLLAKSCP